LTSATSVAGSSGEAGGEVTVRGGGDEGASRPSFDGFPTRQVYRAKTETGQRPFGADVG
jgi:hypothetical protein